MLMEAYKEMDKIDDGYWIPIKRKELKEVIGSLIRFMDGRNIYSLFDSSGRDVTFNASIVNRIDFPVKLKSINCSFCKSEIDINAKLDKGIIYRKIDY